MGVILLGAGFGTTVGLNFAQNELNQGFGQIRFCLAQNYVM